MADIASDITSGEAPAPPEPEEMFRKLDVSSRKELRDALGDALPTLLA